MVKKIFLGLKSVYTFVKYKVIFGKNININLINSIRGKLKINIDNNGYVAIGKFMMTTGPCYIKCDNGGELHIGNNCFMNHNVSITSNKSIDIGDYVNIANNVVIVDHDHIVTHDGVLGDVISSPVIIGDRVWIAANCVITKGVTIGSGSVIAAGSVVTKNIPEHEMWGGVPAKFIKSL